MSYARLHQYVQSLRNEESLFDAIAGISLPAIAGSTFNGAVVPVARADQLTATADALSNWPGTMIVVSHDSEFVERLKPQRVLFMPDGELDYWTNELLDLVALA